MNLRDLAGKCGKEMQRLHNLMDSIDELFWGMSEEQGVGLYGAPKHCFRYLLPKGNSFGVVKISISVPPLSNNGTQWVYETALVGADNHFVYNKELGYPDVRQFFSRNDVVKEVLRVQDLVES